MDRRVQRRTKKSRFASVAVIVLSAAVLLSAILFADGPERLLGALRSVRVPYLLAGAGCMAAYWALESASLHIVSKKLYPAQKIQDSVAVSMIGQLFNCITPFASGGQPIQACQLRRRGMPLGLASSALLVKSIVYQLILSVYSLLALLFRFGFFHREVAGFAPLVLIGFTVNTGVALLLCAACCRPRVAERAALSCAALLHRMRLLRDLERARGAIRCELGKFYQSFRLLRSSAPLLLSLSVFIALQLSAFFMAPYFVCLALGAARPDVLNVIAAGAFVLMISSFVPLPGASGGAEGSFLLFFGMFFPSSLMTRTAVLLWRVITFYLPIAVGSCFTLVSSREAVPPGSASSVSGDSSVMFSQ